MLPGGDFGHQDPWGRSFAGGGLRYIRESRAADIDRVPGLPRYVPA
jgi:hypothetical protein